MGTILEALSGKHNNVISIHDLPVGQPFRWVKPRGGEDVVCLKLENKFGLISWTREGDPLVSRTAWTPLTGDNIGQIYQCSYFDSSESQRELVYAL